MTGTDTCGRLANCWASCLTWLSCLCMGMTYGLMGIVMIAGAITGILVLILWIFGPGVIPLFIARPHAVASTVSSASLTQFALSPNYTLQYNLTLGMTIHNPNKRLGLYYHKVESVALFQDQRFGYAHLDDFYQHTRNTTQLTMAFQGNQLTDGDATAAIFSSQQAAGVFSVSIKLQAKVGKAIGNLVVDGPKLEITCLLSLPAPGNSSATARFKPVDCNVSF